MCSMLYNALFICSMLAEKLDMDYEEAERWIVDLIRQAKLDAKIDSQQVRFDMHVHHEVSKFYIS